MNILDQLTLEAKIALEGEIALSFYLSTSLADSVFKAYHIINEAKEELRPYIVETIAKVASIEPEVLQKVLIEIGMNSLPRWIWYDKCIQDLKDSMAVLSSMKENSRVACLDKSEAKKYIITSSFIKFCRRSSLRDPKTTINLCKKIMHQEKELDFLIPACHVLIDEITRANLKTSKEAQRDIMKMIFDIRDLLSFESEKAVADVPIEKNDTKKLIPEEEPPIDQVVIKEIHLKSSSTEAKEAILKELKNFFGDPVAEAKAALEPECYVVKKIFKGSKVETVLRAFPTREEAEKFIEEMEKNYPELLITCEFEICKKA